MAIAAIPSVLYKMAQTTPITTATTCPAVLIWIDIAAFLPGLTITGLSVGAPIGGVDVGVLSSLYLYVVSYALAQYTSLNEHIT